MNYFILKFREVTLILKYFPHIYTHTQLKLKSEFVELIEL